MFLGSQEGLRRKQLSVMHRKGYMVKHYSLVTPLSSALVQDPAVWAPSGSWLVRQTLALPELLLNQNLI